jgi:hypothetical protein
VIHVSAAQIAAISVKGSNNHKTVDSPAAKPKMLITDKAPYNHGQAAGCLSSRDTMWGAPAGYRTEVIRELS